MVGAQLDRIASVSVGILHDRKIPRSRANIDHLAVTADGVWVIDAKRYQNKRPELRVEGGIIRPRVEMLVVGGREQTKLVDGVLKQVELVRGVVGGDVPVRGVLCFADADWPLFGGEFAVNGVDVWWPKKLVAKMTAGSGGVVDVPAVTARLAGHFGPA